eukprot:TCONS_00025264-protein
MSSEDENDFATRKRKKKRSVIESEDEEEEESEDDDDNDDTPEIGVKRKRGRNRSENAITESDDEDDNNQSETRKSRRKCRTVNYKEQGFSQFNTPPSEDGERQSSDLEIVNGRDHERKKTENIESSLPLRRSRRLKGKTQTLIENEEFSEENPIPEFDAMTPKRSNRLKLKAEKQSPTPSKLQEMEKIENINFDEKEVRYFRKVQSRKAVNNLVACFGPYNQERRGDYAEDYYTSDDSFIDDQDQNVYRKKKKTEKPKRRTKTEGSSEESEQNENESDHSNDNSYRRTTRTSRRNSARKNQNVGDSSSENENEREASENDSCGDCIRNRRPGKMNEAIKSRRAAVRERSTKQGKLEKLKELRKSKGLSLKERETVLKSSDEDDDENDGMKDPFQFHESDREFIKDSSTETSEDDGHSSSGEAKRVLLPLNASSDEELDELSLDENEKRFFEAVKSNELKVVDDMLSTYRFINILDENKNNAIHLATKMKHLDMVKLLLKYHANPNALNGLEQVPALYYAALNKDIACFKELFHITDIFKCNAAISEHHNGKTLLQVLVEQDVEQHFFDVGHLQQCIDVLRSSDEKSFRKMLRHRDKDASTPLVAALKTESFQGVRSLCQILVELQGEMVNCFIYDTDQGGNLVHLAVQYSVLCLNELLPFVKDQINGTDINGWTPLMYACELGHFECMKVLHECGASVEVKDANWTTPLHLASARGNLDAIQYLLKAGHSVNCQDIHGWLPLFYANFQTDKQIVIELFNKNPGQLFTLGQLISNNVNAEMRDKNVKIIQDILESISHIDTYYTLFNDFIGRNMSLLDANNLGLFVNAWKRILNFKNKLQWLKIKHYQFSSCSVKADRGDVLGSAMDQLPYAFSVVRMDANFKGEAGICLGPKREFLSCLVKDIVDPKRGIFTSKNKKHYSPVPNNYFWKRMSKEDKENHHQASPLISGDSQEISDQALMMALEKQAIDEQEEKLLKMKDQMKFTGRFLASIILSEEHVEMQLTNTFIQQILGIKVEHPESLKIEDLLHYSSIKNNDVEELYLPFSTTFCNPWSMKHEEICLSEEPSRDLTEANKEEFLISLSKLLYEEMTKSEVQYFKEGFYTPCPCPSPDAYVTSYNLHVPSLLV